MSQQENETKAQVFSNRLIGARNLKMFSQQEFADRLGTSLRSVQNWEGGHFVPQGKTLRKICEILEVTAGYLFGEQDQPTSRIYGGTGTEMNLRDAPAPGVAERCLIHLRRFLDTCGHDEDRLGWTYIELQQRFPLDKWNPLPGVSEAVRDVALGSRRVAEEIAKSRRDNPERPPSDKAASPSGNKGERDRGARRKTGSESEDQSQARNEPT